MNRPLSRNPSLEGITPGIVIETLNDETAIPIWRTSWNTKARKYEKIGYQPILRLINRGGRWLIKSDPDDLHWGMVCYVPEGYLGVPVYAVKITRVHNASVQALPMRYVDVELGLEAETFTGVPIDRILDLNRGELVTSNGDATAEDIQKISKATEEADE